MRGISLERLRHADLRRLFDFLLDLYAFRDHAAFTTQVTANLKEAIGAKLCSYNELDGASGQAISLWAPLDYRPLPDVSSILGRYAHQIPMLRHFEQTGDGRPRKFTDFMTSGQYHRLDIYNEMYRPGGVPYAISMALGLAGQRTLALALGRKHRDFTERDRAFLTLVQPHLRQAFGNARAVTRLHEELATRAGAVEELTQGVLAADRRGRIQWASDRARRLLVSYGLQREPGRETLPAQVRAWLQAQESEFAGPDRVPRPATLLVVEGASGRLQIRLVRQGDHRIVFLEEQRSDVQVEALAPLGLSPREAEILSWVAQGKTNSEIGTIVGISERTVQKHLERVYLRLGVENRHAAMTLAWQAARNTNT